MEDRFAKIMVGLFIAVMLGLIVVFCCSCCCHRAKNKKPGPEQIQQPNGQQGKRKKASPLTRVAIVVGFVALCYIISFFVEGGSNRNPKYDGWGGRGRGRGQDDASVDIPAVAPPPISPTTEAVTSTITLPLTTSTLSTTSTSTTEAIRTWGYEGKGIK